MMLELKAASTKLQAFPSFLIVLDPSISSSCGLYSFPFRHPNSSQKNPLTMATSVPETEPDAGHYGDTAELDEKETTNGLREDGKRELLDSDAWEVLGYSFPTWRKWQILCVVFLIQISMNLNASMYANAVDGITEKFHVSKQAARVPQMTFLVSYAFGCELWAPWSEEFGRWPIQQLST